MNELQKQDFEVLKYFKKITEENDLEYFLYAGTLLGAVRHKGFIPWDDDVDVIMRRSEFEKFEDIMINGGYINDVYSYQSRKVNKYHAMEFSKIRSNTLNVKERLPKTQKGNYGPWVDIFVLDNIPNDDQARREQFDQVQKYNAIIKKFLLVQVEPSDKGIRKVLKKVVQTFNEIFHPINPILNSALKKRKEWITKYNDQETTHFGELGYMYLKDYEEYKGYMFDKKDYETTVDVEFEGELFKSPEDYDKALTLYYGDYMTLPPEEDRKIHKMEQA